MTSSNRGKILPVAGFTIIVASSVGIAFALWSEASYRLRDSILLNSGLSFLVGCTLVGLWVFSKASWRPATEREEWERIKEKGFLRFYLGQTVFPLMFMAGILSLTLGGDSSNLRDRFFRQLPFLIPYFLISTISPWLKWRNNERRFQS